MISRDLIASSLPDSTAIVWEGFNSDLGTLRRRGWIVQELPAFHDWKNPKDSKASHRYLYIRHPQFKTIGRTTIPDSGNEVLVLDFLSQESNKWVRPPRVFEERNLTADDIPALLDLIAAIQDSQPRIRRKRAQIIELRATA